MDEKITVKLIGEDGNAFHILEKVKKALERNGQEEDAEKFMEEAMSSDYDHLLRTAMKYVDME